MKQPLSFLAVTLALAACGTPPQAGAPVVIAPVGAPQTATLADSQAASAPDPEPRPGTTRRFLRLPVANAPGAPLRVGLGFVDVRFPSAMSGLAVATVKRRGDPCGPGYQVTLTRAQSRFAVVSPDPMPDVRLLGP